MVTQTSPKRTLRIMLELARKPYLMPAEDVARELNHNPIEANSLFIGLLEQGRLEVSSEFYDETDRVDVVMVRLPKFTGLPQDRAC